MDYGQLRRMKSFAPGSLEKLAAEVREELLRFDLTLCAILVAYPIVQYSFGRGRDRAEFGHKSWLPKLTGLEARAVYRALDELKEKGIVEQIEGLVFSVIPDSSLWRATARFAKDDVWKSLDDVLRGCHQEQILPVPEGLNDGIRQVKAGLWQEVEVKMRQELEALQSGQQLGSAADRDQATAEKFATKAKNPDAPLGEICHEGKNQVPVSGKFAMKAKNPDAPLGEICHEGKNDPEMRENHAKLVALCTGGEGVGSELIADPACTLKALSSLSCTEGTGEHCTAKAAKAAQLLNDAKFSDKLRSSDEDFSEAVFQQLRAIDNCGALTPGRIREWSKIVERSPDKVKAAIRMVKRTGWVDKDGRKISNHVAYLAAVGRDENW